MNVKKSATAVLMLSAIEIGTLIGLSIRANAQPYPGCPFKTSVVFDVCSDYPGVPGLTPGFTLVEGVPGTFGPRGMYTPIQDGR